ncbi:MAG: DUF3800 domain-containing protein [Chloroflexota bacterium]
MYLVYLGESGNTGTSTNDANQPHHVHVGLLVHENHWVSMNGEFNALHRRHFGRPPADLDPLQELRPAHIHQGLGVFASWPPAKRAELIQDCLNILIRRETPMIVAYVNKGEFAQARANGASPSSLLWQNPSESVINRLLFALHMFMDELNTSGVTPDQIMEAAWPINDYALVVAGEGGSVEPRFMAQFLKSEPEIPAPAVLENFCYVEPGHSPCTQLANLCAYLARRWLQNPSAPQPYFDALRDGKVVQVIYPVQF